MTKGKAPPKIAILGWGSLIWDEREEFDKHHGAWTKGGPLLKLEFSRISETRKEALTLVIDDHGDECPVHYALSARRNPDDAIADLRCREGTVMRHMGFYFRDKSRQCTPAVPDSIPSWAEKENIDVVVWTGLPSNFEDKKDTAFSVSAAIQHLQNLTPEGKALAATYVWRAPDFVDTELRRALQKEPWFAPLAATSSDLSAVAEPPPAQDG